MLQLYARIANNSRQSHYVFWPSVCRSVRPLSLQY